MNRFDQPSRQDFGMDFGLGDTNGENNGWMSSLNDPSLRDAWPPVDNPLDPFSTVPFMLPSTTHRDTTRDMWLDSPYQATTLEDTAEWMLADASFQAAADAPNSFHNRMLLTSLPPAPPSPKTMPEDNSRDDLPNSRRADSGIGSFDDSPDFNNPPPDNQWIFDQAVFDGRSPDDFFHTDHPEENNDESQRTGPLQYHLIKTKSRTNVRTVHSEDVKTEICPLCPNKQYTGAWAHRNLTRHMEAMHAPCASSTGLKQIKCSLNGCGRTFRRDDARLVHERRSHPELNRPPAAKRKRSDDF